MEKPGEKALLAMKELNNRSIVLFKTPDLPKKNKAKVEILTEEKYVEELSKIIQRDFFPDLERLKAQNQYLDAMEKNDVAKLRELYAKYTLGNKPSIRSGGHESPLTFETPRPGESPILKSSRSNKSTSSKRSTNSSSQNMSENHSLDSFLTNYTSEDNNSFHEIIEAADRKLRQKFAVLYEAENQQAIEMSEALTLPSIEKQFEKIEDGPRKVNTWSYKNKNYIMYVPDGVFLTKHEQIEKAKRKMEIVHLNTRLVQNPFDEQQSKETITELAKTQAKIWNGKIGVDGNTLKMGNNTPQVRGFSYVKTPSPCPGVTDSPLMTWGEIEGTPFRLDGSDTPLRTGTGPSFRIAETSRREVLALELAEKAGERMRGQKAKAIEAAKRNIGSPYVRLSTMSPLSTAARRLATMKFGLKESTINLTTPSPSPLRSLSKTPKLTPSPLVRKKTPIRRTHDGQQSEQNTTKTTLTDDLLKIPNNRNRAADFF